MKKSIVFSLCFIQSLFSNEINVEPTGELMLRFTNKDIKYNTLGATVLNKKTYEYSNMALGGDIGLVFKTQKFDFIVQGSGVTKIIPLDSSDKLEPTYFDNDKNDFFYLSNIYLKKSIDNINIKIGRQQYNNFLVNRNDKLISNQYEGIYVDYEKNDFKINSLYFNKMASSTISNSVPFNHNYGILGYGKGYKIGSFTDLSQHISNKDYDSFGAIVTDFTYGSKFENINIQNLYVDNFFNTLFVAKNNQFDFYDMNLITSFGYVKQFDVGDNSFAKDYGDKKIDSKMYQGKIRLKKDNYFLVFKYAYTPYEDSLLNGAIISPFSNKLGWIYGVQTAHSFISDTKSNELAFGMMANIFDKKTLIYLSSIKYIIGEKNALTHSKLNTKENYIHTKLFLSKNSNLVLQYSKTYNFNLLTDKSNSFRAFLNFKF